MNEFSSSSGFKTILLAVVWPDDVALSDRVALAQDLCRSAGAAATRVFADRPPVVLAEFSQGILTDVRAEIQVEVQAVETDLSDMYEFMDLDGEMLAPIGNVETQALIPDLGERLSNARHWEDET